MQPPYTYITGKALCESRHGAFFVQRKEVKQAGVAAEVGSAFSVNHGMDSDCNTTRGKPYPLPCLPIEAAMKGGS